MALGAYRETICFVELKKKPSSHFAATLALATVFAFAAHVAGFASPLALATVHAFAVMPVQVLLILGILAGISTGAACHGESGTRSQTGHGRGNN
jgi:F0F1-type ATP synthase membrane subunit a